jgi:hypothetical protein
VAGFQERHELLTISVLFVVVSADALQVLDVVFRFGPAHSFAVDVVDVVNLRFAPVYFALDKIGFIVAHRIQVDFSVLFHPICFNAS